MNIAWNPGEHPDTENFKWANLRAMEWLSLPSFVTQPIAPILLLFFSSWQVVAFIALLNIVWRFFRYNYFSSKISSYSVYFVKLKWITFVLLAVYFYMNNNIEKAIVSALWTPISYVLMVFSMPSEVGRFEKTILKSMGYGGIESES